MTTGWNRAFTVRRQLELRCVLMCQTGYYGVVMIGMRHLSEVKLECPDPIEIRSRSPKARMPNQLR